MRNQDFDVYLARGSNLSQRYRDEATEKPNQAIDSTILTASRRTPVFIATAEPQSWFKRWRIPLSVAAVMMLGVGVTLRTVMQEAKLSAPPPGVSLPQPASAPPVAPAERVENNGAAESAADAAIGGAASSSSTQTPQLAPSRANKKGAESEGVEEVLVDKRPASAFPAAPPSMPQDKATTEVPLPAPHNSAAAKQDALESQAQSGSSSNKLGKSKSASLAESDDVSAESSGEAAKRNDESLARRRDQAIPNDAENEARPAPAAPESAPPAPPQAFPSDELRLPESHPPIVDGKTYRTDKAKAIREATEKKQSRGAVAIVDNIEDAPEAWLRRVAELRRLGRIEEANSELERFRKRYPDYPAPIEP